MADARIETPKVFDKGTILATGQRRYAPGTTKRRDSNGDTGAGAFRVPRPGIIRIRVDQPGELIQHAGEPALPCVVLVQMLGDAKRIDWVDFGAAADRLGAVPQPFEVKRDPVGRNPAICVGGHQNIVGGEAACRMMQREAACESGGRACAV